MARSTLVGRPGSPGVGLGRLLWAAPETGPGTRGSAAVLGATPPLEAADRTATGRLGAPGAPSVDPATERARLRSALDAAAAELTALAADVKARAGDDVGAIFEAQALFATDPGLVDPAMEAIDAGATAEEAFDRVAATQADALAAVDDEYFRERAADVRDIARRVVDGLTGRERLILHRTDGSPAVLASDDLDPSVVVAIRPELVSGLALAGGAPNGHAAIVARALGIPLVLGLGGAVDPALDGVEVAVDGSGGRLFVEPDDADLASLVPMAPVSGPSTSASTDGRLLPVEVAANVGSVREAEAAASAGADAIGLVRTELLFLGRSVPPGLEEQRSLYRRIARALPGRRVVFRTLDIGGDKPAPYLAGDAEMNPALGVRGVRLGLAHPELFETQLRALLEAAPERPAWILLPMVAATEEVEAARAALSRAAAASRNAGVEIAGDVRLGVMVEIPSAALMADALAPIVDFFSIGTNDLVQYTLAADRTSASLAELATPLQPAVLRLVRFVTEAAGGHGRHVSVCGEAAADPLAAGLFVGLGVDELSVAPAAVGRVREMLAGVDPARCREAAAQACAAGSVGRVQAIAEALVGR